MGKADIRLSFNLRSQDGNKYRVETSDLPAEIEEKEKNSMALTQK